jgi:hypothetical protein
MTMFVSRPSSNEMIVEKTSNSCSRRSGFEQVISNDIIWFIKKQRLNWLGHVERMTEDNNVQKIKRWKPMSKRPIGRPKTRWEDMI